MKTLMLFLIMASAAFGGEHKSMIACQIASATLQKSAVTPNKVPRSECSVCGGSGKVKAGDGNTVVWRECDNCYADAKKVKELTKYILMFTASWCGPCSQMKGNLKSSKDPNSPPLCWLMSSGWQIGPTGHIRLVDYDRQIDLRNQFRVTALPTLILIDRGKEVKRHTGYMSAHQIADFYKNAPARRVVLSRNSKSQWTWPGDLREHLIKEHGLPKSEVMQASQAQLQKWHDSIHNKIGPR